MKVVTFGELMVRLQPFNYERFVQANSLEFTFGGGEANVAVSLANYGLDAAFVTKLPAHAIGQAAVKAQRGLPDFSDNTATTSSFKPRFRIVSIIPGMEALAPERTETSSGFSTSPNFLPVTPSILVIASMI